MYIIPARRAPQARKCDAANEPSGRLIPSPGGRVDGRGYCREGVMKKQLVRGGLLVALVILLGFVGLWWSALADAVTPENATRIKLGMSLKAVNGLLGQQGQPVDEAMPLTGGENH